MASRSVLILPDDSPEPILAAIGAAVHTLRVKMFVFSDPALLKAVIDAKKRGVAVKVMLNPARRNGEDDNAESRKALEQGSQSILNKLHTDRVGLDTDFVVKMDKDRENYVKADVTQGTAESIFSRPRWFPFRGKFGRWGSLLVVGQFEF